MGGKRKQAQRTKNNAKPSSSGRSAEFLGSSVSQFVGLSGIKEGTLILPGFSLTTDEIDSSVDSNFQLVLKKMNKKDSTTKLKALQEFTELCKTLEIDVIKAILPFWPRLYCSLATDSEHRVREAAHIAHTELVLKAKKNLAPYLKQLVGVWFTSQYDTYPPAATAATKAFETAFPPNKLNDAIAFCQEEILSYIYDSILVQTTQTLSNPKATSSEDAEAKYQRVVVSSLQGYALYLNKMSPDQIKKVSEQNSKIVTNQKFWKLAKNKISSIRAAWFSVISMLCQKASFLVENESAHITGTVFSNLDASDPIVLSNVWEAVLSIVTTIKEWWKYVNVEKLVLNKLWKILREGGQGNATVIYPNLLPFLSHLPPVADMNVFYSTFFENIRLGLKHKTAIASRSEAVAISAAFIECLQFVILRNQNDIALCEKLIQMQLMPSIEVALTESHSSYKILFNRISTMVQYWARNVENIDVPHYKHYLQYFWDNLDSLFQGLLLDLELNFKKDAISNFASKQVEFLQSLKHVSKSKKQMKVSFSSEPQIDQTEQKVQRGEGFSESYLQALDDLVLKVCKSYVNLINEKKSKELVQYLFILLHDLEHEKFFKFLNLEALNAAHGNFFEIYEKLFMHWLKDGSLCSTYVIDLVFLFLKHTSEEEKLRILNSFLELPNEEVFSWCIKKALSFPYNEWPLIHCWLKKEKIGRFFIEISEKILSNQCSPDMNLILKQAFEENKDGELLITKSTIEDIIKNFVMILSSPLKFASALDACVRFATHITGAIYSEAFKLTYGDNLLLAIFKLSCSSNTMPDILSKDTAWEIRNVWQDVISMLSRELPLDEFQRTIKKIANIIEEQVLKENGKEDASQDHIVNVVISLIKSIHTGSPLRINDAMHILLKREFLNNCEKAMTNLCKRAEFVKGYLSCPYKKLEENVIGSEININNYFSWRHLCINILTATLPGDNVSGHEDEDDESCEEQEIWIIDCLSEAELLILENIYAIALAQSFIDHYKNTMYYTKMMQHHSSIKQKLNKLIKNNKQDLASKVEVALCKEAMKEGWIWARAVHLFYSDISPKPLSSSYEKIISNYHNEITSEVHVLHLGQVFSKSLNYDHVQFDLMPIENIICLRSLLHCEGIDVQVAEVFTKIDKIKQEKQRDFLLESDSLNWEQIQITTEVIRLFSTIIQTKEDYMTSNRWDFAVVAFTTWLENIVKMKNNFRNVEVAALIAAISNLFISIRKHLLLLEERTPNAAKNIINEWRDLFACDVHKFIIELWLHFMDYYQNHPTSLEDLPLLQEFGKTIQYLDYKYLFNEDINGFKWNKLLRKCCDLLTHPVNTLQLMAYHMLMPLLPGLIEIDLNSINTDTPHTTGLTIENFKDVLIHTEEIVHSMLLEFKLGEDSCTVQPFTDSYTYTFAYLLLWDVLLNLCSQSSTELRYQYADWIKNNDFLTKLINNIFRLMPSEVLHQSSMKVKPFATLFLEKFSTNFTESFLSLHIEHMVCWIYTQVLSQLPALVRQWWSVKETKVAQIVDRVTSLYVSPQLCSQELADVIQHEKKFKNMTPLALDSALHAGFYDIKNIPQLEPAFDIFGGYSPLHVIDTVAVLSIFAKTVLQCFIRKIKVHPNVREVIAIYTVDEAQMELLITLPTNYPLKVPDLECNKQICGTSHRQWILQLKTNILHQNGRIWDGLSLWNNNLDKKFDGVEECYICFTVLHQGTYQLPKVTCSTCKKRFHSACLYKWFNTSNKSTCPICRSLF